MSGVLQRSVMGPLLFVVFVVYVNDIPDVVSGKVKMYADDTKLYDNHKYSKSLQRDLEKLEQ